MARKLISSGSKFEAEMAYSRAVVEGDWIFVSGTTGFNYATMEISEDVAAQAEQTFVFNAVKLDDAAESARVEAIERAELLRLWAGFHE